MIRTCVSISHSDRVAGNDFWGSGGIDPCGKWLLPLMSSTSTWSEERSTSESTGLTALDTQVRMYWGKKRNNLSKLILALWTACNYGHLLQYIQDVKDKIPDKNYSTRKYVQTTPTKMDSYYSYYGHLIWSQTNHFVLPLLQWTIWMYWLYLRNRKHEPCFYRVIQTRVEVWENEKCCGNTRLRPVFPQHFSFSQTSFEFSPNFHKCFV